MRLNLARFHLKVVIAIAGFVAVTLAGSTVQAQTLFTGSGCSGNTFEFCGSWTGTYVDATHVNLFLTNTSGAAPASNAGSLFTAIAIGNVAVIDPASMGAVTGWQYASSFVVFNGFGLLENEFGAMTSNGTNNALGAGQSQLFQFTFGSSIGTFAAAQTAFAGAQIGIVDSGGNCTSTGVLPGSGASNNYRGAPCAGSPVPEPSTYVLMATGLIGVIVVARRRRVA